MRAIALSLAAALGLSGCVPTGQNEVYYEHIQTSQCFNGAYAFSVSVNVPQEYGRVLAMTQHEQSSRGLASVCRLNVDNLGSTNFYQIYEGEVSNGRSGLCVSARTQNAGHVMSCASSAEVRRALNAPAGSTRDIITLSQWGQFRE